MLGRTGREVEQTKLKSMTQQREPNGLLLLLFFCSGATALVYEVVWSKFLSQMLGSTIQAQTVVLAVFMGGLALGNRLMGRWSDRARSPLQWYGYLELAIAVYAFFFPQIYQAADAVFSGVGASVAGQPVLLLALKAALSVALLLGPTVLMGGTLPMMAAWLQRHSAEAGRHSARFYSLNSLGAVLGSGVAGFYLVRAWGMVAALQMAALANMAVAGAAIVLSKRAWTSFGQDETGCGSGETDAKPVPALRWAGALVAVTGGVSMGLEVLASRSLALIFGSSLQSFAIVLMAFILGIGLGGAAVSSRWFHRLRGPGVVGALLLISAVWIGVLVSRIEWWVEAYRSLRSGLASSTMGYNYHQFMAGAMAMVILGVPAALIGAVLPLMIRAVAGHGSGLGREVGRLLTWNTFGAVAGVLATGFLLMPEFGLRGAFCVLAGVLAAAGLVAAWRQRSRVVIGLAAGCAAVVGLFLATGSNEWRHALNAGVFRQRETEVDRTALAKRKEQVEILFYEDAADATVSVERYAANDKETNASLSLRINGKADASTSADMCTQMLLGHLPLALRPESTDVFAFGLGSGVTAAAAAAHPVRQVVVAENCAPVIRAVDLFSPWNRGVRTNPLMRLVREDARTVLKLSPQRYDAIIAEPSNPWTAGVGSVFSREFYELAASRLKEGGLMVQWFHTYEMHDGIVNLVLRTFAGVFPHMEIWDSGSGDILLVGSGRSWHTTPATLEKIFTRAQAKADLAAIGIDTPEALLARQLASQQTAFAIAGDGPTQSDLFPVLEYEAPRAFFVGRKARVLCDYDERTWQTDFAPASKQRALRALDEAQVKSIFGVYQSVNPELQNHLQARWNRSAQSGGGRSPCVFVKSSPTPGAADLPPNTSDEVRALVSAAALLEPGSTRVPEGVRQIEQLIRQRGPKADWSVPHYTAFAVGACLRLGDYPAARALLNLGLEKAPQAPLLLYLGRVIERSEKENGRRGQADQVSASQ
jgi:predicted membrane-bound spermidine synthase